MEDFKQWCGLFNMQGVTNGTHVLISKPFIPYPQDYYYHKSKGYSMVAQVMVDSNKKFIDIFIGLPRNANNSQALKFGLYQQAQYHVLFFQTKDVEMELHVTYLRTKGVGLSTESRHHTKKMATTLLWSCSTKKNKKAKSWFVVENVFGILKKTL